MATLPENKSSKEAVIELLNDILNQVEIPLPLLSFKKIALMKIDNMSEEQAQGICNLVHNISHKLEKQTGNLSPFHGIEG